MARTHILKGFSDIDTALWLHKEIEGLTVAEMVLVAKEQGLPVTDTANFDAAQVLAELGLSDRDTRSLNTNGSAFYRIWQTRRSDAVDILHGLQYGLWSSSAPGENVASWAYRTICEYLWYRQSLPESADALVRYVQSERSAVELIPPEIGNAFGSKSILDAYDWLLPLDPPVISGVSESGTGRSFRQATFQRRGYCSTPLFMMALDHVLSEQGQQHGDLFMVDAEVVRRICTFCLIDEPAVEIMLDDALRRFPHLLSFQREWGAYVALTRRPVMDDFI